MSDYLWDKTGEPDEEIERLEELLGGFAHKPRALELPAEAAPRTSFFDHTRYFRPALVAAAAALLLMMLAGAVVMLRQNGGDNLRQSADANPRVLPPKKESVVAPPEEPKPSPESPKRDVRTGHSTTAKGPATPDYQASSRKQRRKTLPAASDAGANRQEFHVAALSGSHPGSLFSKAEINPATLSEKQAAKEQLVYAMRLASAKLGEVRKMTRGVDAPRQSFDERNRIR